MVITDSKVKRVIVDKTFYIRTLTKSGSSRYLSVGKILPVDWKAVKVYVDWRGDKSCVLRLEQIK